MKNEIFTTIELSSGTRCSIIEGKGLHYFSAMIKSSGNTSTLMKYLMLELIRVDGVREITESELEEMHIRDINYLIEVISTMMSNQKFL